MAMPRKDITGQMFNRLTVVSFSHTDRESHWHCRCDCGTMTVVRGGRLRSGETESCGCVAIERRPRIHGMTDTRTYRIYRGMTARTSDPTVKDWPRYGGRGIKKDPRWSTFAAFLADMGACPGPDYTLDRIDNDGDYSPENCRWATWKQQARNKRRQRWVEYRGRRMPLSEACELAGAGVDWHKARNRIRMGWPLERAVEFAGDGRTT